VRFLALVQELVDWLQPFFSTFGYLIVPVAMALESGAFTGIVVPGDVILAIGGVYAAQGDLALPLVIGLAWLGALVGSTAGYLLGRRYGESFVKRLPLFNRFEDRIEDVKGSIERNAGKTIVVGRFVTGAGGFIPFVAGTSRVRPMTFFLYTIPTLLVWTTALSLIGFFVGNNVDAIDRILSTIGWVGVGILVLIFVVWFVRHRRRQRAAAPRDQT
jgi:membrane protein DedA with SNARE-associated domain